MPNNAGTFDSAAPSFVRVGLSFIDANGGQDSASWITTVARATDANINAMAAAIGAASNASVFEIRKEVVMADNPGSPSNAVEAPRESVKDHILILFRHPSTRMTQEGVIPAPLDAIMVPETNDVDVTNALYLAVETATENLLDASYDVVSTRFNETKKINKKTRR